MARQARILLVDDRPENLVALDAILSSMDQILVPVRSGEQAVQAVLADEYAVVLLDVRMPRMDGFETAAQIKRHARGRDVPIIFLTAATEPARAGLPELCGRRGRLPGQAVRPLGPEGQGVGLRRPVPQAQASGRWTSWGPWKTTLALLRTLPAVRRDAEAAETAAQLATAGGTAAGGAGRFGRRVG